MIILGNDDGKKMVERDEALEICDEYSRITGIKLKLLGASERPDFACERGGVRCGLELVRVMQSPATRVWQRLVGHEGGFDPNDAALGVQEWTYVKDRKRAEPDWQFQDDTMLVLQLMDCDGATMLEVLDDELMDEMSETGFSEIWVADYSPMDAYGTLQLIGIKPRRWRGLHQHRFFGMKPYG